MSTKPIERLLFAQGGLPPELQNAAAMHFLGKVTHLQAYTMGFRDSFLITAVVFTVGLIPAWIMGRRVVAIAVPRKAAA